MTVTSDGPVNADCRFAYDVSYLSFPEDIGITDISAMTVS